jgi:hypothetical protein
MNDYIWQMLQGQQPSNAAFLNPGMPPTMTPPFNPASQLPSRPDQAAGLSGLDKLIRSPSGAFILNLLAQSGRSLTPGPGPAAAIGRAALASSAQRQQLQMSEMQRQLIESTIGLNKKRMETAGAVSDVKASTDRGKALQDFRNGLITEEALNKRLGEIDAAERRNVNKSTSDLRAERDKTTAPVAAGLQSIRAAEALLNSDNPFADVASLTSFIKSIDNSVVRPSEMDAYNASVGLLNQVESIYQRAKGDGVLTPASRQALRKSLQALRENYQTILEGQNEFYREEAKASGVEPSRVLRGLDPGAVPASSSVTKPPDVSQELWDVMTPEEKEAFRE